VDYSYYVAPTYGTDQYTGKTVVVQGGQGIDNRSIQFTIKNQLFTPYIDENGTQIRLYYNFRIKGAYGTEWDYFPFAPEGWTTRRYGGGSSTPENVVQSNGEYTVISFQIPGVYRVPSDAVLEVQVQAIVGYIRQTDHGLAGYVYTFTGERSQWSSTQTVQVTADSSASTIAATPTQTATPTPTQMPPTPQNQTAAAPNQQNPSTEEFLQLDWSSVAIFILFVAVAVLVVVVAVQQRRLSKLAGQISASGS
jgi:hypothetical protein